MKKTVMLIAIFLLASFAAAFNQNPKLAGLPANTWMILDSTGIQLEGHFAYSGGTLDRTNHKFLVFGGGHWDGSQNNVLCFDIATDTWNSMYTPTPSSAYTCSNVNSTTPGMLLAQHMPASRHTYDMMEFMDHIGKFIMWSGPTYSSIWSCPGNTLPADTWLYDWASNTWEYKNETRMTQPSGEAMCGVYNPANHLYYGFNNSDFYVYNATTDAWTKLPSSTGTKPTGYDHSMVGDRQGQYYYLFDGQMKVYRVQNNTWTGTTGAPSGTNDNPSYDEVWNDVLCLGSNASAMHVFHTDTRTWEVLDPDGPTPAMDNICYGRFFYDPVDSVHLYMAQVSYHARTYAYRYKRGGPTAVDAGAAAVKAGMEIAASPNPFAAGITIRTECKMENEKCKVQIFSPSGRLVHQSGMSTTGQYTWNAQGLPSGIYLLKIKIPGKTLTKRLFLQK